MKIEIKDNFLYRIGDENENELYAKFNTSKENVFRNNPNITLYKGELVRIKINNYITHFVKPTETLTSLAQKYNTNEDEIKQYNNLKNDKLFIGQRIKIHKTKN